MAMPVTATQIPGSSKHGLLWGEQLPLHALRKTEQGTSHRMSAVEGVAARPPSQQKQTGQRTNLFLVSPAQQKEEKGPSR